MTFVIISDSADTTSSPQSQIHKSADTMEIARRPSSGGPARIVKPLTDLHVKHGDQIKLVVNIECDPPPEIIWSFQVTIIQLSNI